MTQQPELLFTPDVAIQAPPATPLPVLRWYLCDLVSGGILTELPLTVDSISVKIASKDQATFTLAPADPSCSDDWAELLVDGRSMIVLTIDDQPTAAWWVESHTVGGTTVPIVANTLEQCADRTNVPDVEINTATDVAAIAALVAAPLVTRFGFYIEHVDTGVTRDDSLYESTVDRSIFSALTEDFLQADDGPEWRIIVRWTNTVTRTGFDKVLQIQAKIGDDRPDAVFDLDANGHGCIDSYTRELSYAAGKGATMLIGVSDGSGSTRPMTDPPLVSPLVDAGWPVVEERHSFTGLDTGTVDEEDALLRERTQALLVKRQTGGVAWTVTGTVDAPVPGRDYSEGDTVYIDVAPQGKQDPVGGSARVRVLGWELDLASRRGTPLLWPDDDDQDATV